MNTLIRTTSVLNDKPFRLMTTSTLNFSGPNIYILLARLVHVTLCILKFEANSI
jgi:hypothetical protein